MAKEPRGHRELLRLGELMHMELAVSRKLTDHLKEGGGLFINTPIPHPIWREYLMARDMVERQQKRVDAFNRGDVQEYDLIQHPQGKGPQ